MKPSISDGATQVEQRASASSAPGGSPLHNHFLAALPNEERSALLAHAQRIEFPARTTLAAMGETLEHCYFIEQGVVSCVLQLSDGFEGASAIIGSEGLVGLHAVAGTSIIAPHDAIIQVPTVAQRVPATVVRDALSGSPELLGRILRFNEALRLQLAQSTICNLHHHLPQRLARWLLTTYDRATNGELALTQEALSALVGATRASVTQAAMVLRDAGAIGYRYGRISLHDRQHLEDISCECYGIVCRHYQHLLGWPA
jgi:CRP-like cAMP-binding protein